MRTRATMIEPPPNGYRGLEASQRPAIPISVLNRSASPRRLSAVWARPLNGEQHPGGKGQADDKEHAAAREADSHERARCSSECSTDGSRHENRDAYQDPERDIGTRQWVVGPAARRHRRIHRCCPAGVTAVRSVKATTISNTKRPRIIATGRSRHQRFGLRSTSGTLARMRKNAISP